MITQHILSTALAALAPAERTPPDFESRLDHVELVGGQADPQLIAYDSEGEVIGTIAIWVEPDGRFFLASDYGDGYVETVVVDGRAHTEATLPPEVIATRSNAMLDYAVRGVGTQEGKVECAAKVVLAGIACAKLSLACPFSVYWAACECAPLVMDEFECPDW